MSVHLDLFMENEDRLLNWVLERYADSSVGQACGCNNPDALRTTRCYDCNHPPTCSECYIHVHKSSPTHWAEVWNPQLGFFVRHDISMLRPNGYSISLGHSGLPCPSASIDEAGVNFHLIDTNGIHQTRIQFCHCRGDPDRAEQLMRARYFPATPLRPTTAFTWQVLHLFHLQQLEAKISAYDFVGSLRRMTNNSFAQDTPVGLLLLDVLFNPQHFLLSRTHPHSLDW